MSKPLIVKNVINISAPVSKVWDALLNPEQTKKYMFGCENVSDGKIESPLLWKGIFDGKEMIAVKGNTVSFEPEKFLAYTTMDPNSLMDDIAENYLTVTYSLSKENEETILTVTRATIAKLPKEKKYIKKPATTGKAGIPFWLK